METQSEKVEFQSTSTRQTGTHLSRWVGLIVQSEINKSVITVPMMMMMMMEGGWMDGWKKVLIHACDTRKLRFNQIVSFFSATTTTPRVPASNNFNISTCSNYYVITFFSSLPVIISAEMDCLVQLYFLSPDCFFYVIYNYFFNYCCAPFCYSLLTALLVFSWYNSISNKQTAGNCIESQSQQWMQSSCLYKVSQCSGAVWRPMVYNVAKRMQMRCFTLCVWNAECLLSQWWRARGRN